MKKLLSLVACGAIALTCATTPVSAGTGLPGYEGINAEELRVLNYLFEGFELEGLEISFDESSEEYKAVLEILSEDGMDLTAEAVDAIKLSALSTIDYLKANVDTEMTMEMFNEMLKLADPGLSILGLEVEYDAINDLLTFLNQDGESVYAAEGLLTGKLEKSLTPASTTKLEKTGENLTSTYALIGVLAVVLVGAGIYTFRKRESLN